MHNTLVINKRTMFEHYIESLKFHIKESLLALCTGIFGMITLKDIPTILSIIGIAIGTVILPIFFGYRRNRKKEERERESAVIRAIKDLRELGFIDPILPIDEQRAAAIEWLSKPIDKFI